MKNILLGVCGSIAAHKTPGLVEELSKRYNVYVVITESATNFVSKMALGIISGNEVLVGITEVTSIEKLLKEIDLVLVAPISANTIGKLANGLIDNSLCTVLNKIEKNKIIICPAMNPRMYNQAIMKNNLNTLKKQGITIVEPIECVLASGDLGVGGLATNEQIIKKVSNWNQ